MRYTGTDPSPVVVYGYGAYVPSGVLYNLYDKYSPISDTVRRNWNMPEYTYSANTSPRTSTVIPTGTKTFERDCGKWKRDFEKVLPKQRDWGPTNFPVLRYADVLLMYAEAENEIDGPLVGTVTARDYINKVRVRSQAQIIFPSLVTSKAACRQIIMDERARELCFEGLRKFDLIRWGIFNSQMDFTRIAISNSSATTGNKAHYLEAYNNVMLRDTLLPIPSVELSVNNLMTQNPGW
jgi:hypothetical protein